MIETLTPEATVFAHRPVVLNITQSPDISEVGPGEKITFTVAAILSESGSPVLESIPVKVYKVTNGGTSDESSDYLTTLNTDSTGQFAALYVTEDADVGKQVGLEFEVET